MSIILSFIWKLSLPLFHRLLKKTKTLLQNLILLKQFYFSISSSSITISALSILILKSILLILHKLYLTLKLLKFLLSSWKLNLKCLHGSTLNLLINPNHILDHFCSTGKVYSRKSLKEILVIEIDIGYESCLGISSQRILK